MEMQKLKVVLIAYSAETNRVECAHVQNLVFENKVLNPCMAVCVERALGAMTCSDYVGYVQVVIDPLHVAQFEDEENLVYWINSVAKELL